MFPRATNFSTTTADSAAPASRHLRVVAAAIAPPQGEGQHALRRQEERHCLGPLAGEHAQARPREQASGELGAAAAVPAPRGEAASAERVLVLAHRREHQQHRGPIEVRLKGSQELLRRAPLRFATATAAARAAGLHADLGHAEDVPTEEHLWHRLGPLCSRHGRSSPARRRRRQHRNGRPLRLDPRDLAAHEPRDATPERPQVVAGRVGVVRAEPLVRHEDHLPVVRCRVGDQAPHILKHLWRLQSIQREHRLERHDLQGQRPGALFGRGRVLPR
mmetsp:Transcript_162006/g.519415  ORF Transcript_162006/g.519415 Transcript_162006/m.519415 type:complete len:276 (+) Transcript_162006:2537-3364(+)